MFSVFNIICISPISFQSIPIPSYPIHFALFVSTINWQSASNHFRIEYIYLLEDWERGEGWNLVIVMTKWMSFKFIPLIFALLSIKI